MQHANANVLNNLIFLPLNLSSPTFMKICSGTVLGQNVQYRSDSEGLPLLIPHTSAFNPARDLR